jgi:SnoaL-like protein
MSAAAGLVADDLVGLRQLVDAYADAIDRRDGEALLGLFGVEAQLRVQAEHGPVESSYQGPAITDSLDTLAGFHRTFHHVGGAVFEAAPEGDGFQATGRVHCLAHHYDRSSNGPVDLVMMIRYLDRYSRGDDDRWLFADRQVVIEWTELHAAYPARRVVRREPT